MIGKGSPVLDCTKDSTLTESSLLFRAFDVPVLDGPLYDKLGRFNHREAGSPRWIGVIYAPLLELILLTPRHTASLEGRHPHGKLLASEGLESFLEVVTLEGGSALLGLLLGFGHWLVLVEG